MGQRLRRMVARAPVTQEVLAAMLGHDPTVFSRYLRGVRLAPDGFEARVIAMLNKLEEAEDAADEARRRVLEGATHPTEGDG